MANRLAAFHQSNEAMYVANATRVNEVKWKKCGATRNFHILSWNPGLGDSEPEKCERCEVENRCQCTGQQLLAFGCRCGGS